MDSADNKKSVTGISGVVLLLQVPRTNDKKELAAEQMFASLHGLLSSTQKPGLFKKVVHERVSFEIAVQKKRIGFYVWVPGHFKNFVEEQVYAQYPTVHISEVEDYTRPSSSDLPIGVQTSAELEFTSNTALPIKTFPSFEVDPLAAITAALAQFDEDEEAWLQVIMRPATDGWYRKSERYAAGIRSGSGSGMQLIASALRTPANNAASPKLSEYRSAQASAAEEKSHKLAYEVMLRVVYKGNKGPEHARMRLQAITASFKQFNTNYLNGFRPKLLGQDHRYVEQYRSREFRGHGLVCNIEEIASLYHLPHTNVETPNILWANAKTAEPPATLPLPGSYGKDEIAPIAATNFRGHNTAFGLLRPDRSRHLYIIGQTGVGKSALLELLTIADIDSPHGFAVIDPHGDYALNVLHRIPRHRADDVIYFNPADTEYPIAFNPLEIYDSTLRTHVVSELIGVLRRMFESWGPRLEYILRYTLLALVEYPEATMLDITRMLTDKKFRGDVLAYVTDPVVINFWKVEFASWNERFATEAVAPVLNKVGAFTANPIVRNIIGQPKSSFNIRQVMDERKILIVNLTRGLIGEDNASLLGALLVTKMQMAAMSRANIDVDQRTPFYLYVDEFQNFATDSFATILSEARKYGLTLTVANQYIAQMTQGVKDAVFGNVGSIIGFRMSADDARGMTKYFEPKFEDHDLVHMHNRHFVISMTIDGEKAQAFSATTLDLPLQTDSHAQEIIQNSRRKYAVARDDIEFFVRGRYLPPEKLAAAMRGEAAFSERSNNNLVKQSVPARPVGYPKEKTASPGRGGWSELHAHGSEKPARRAGELLVGVIESQPETPPPDVPEQDSTILPPQKRRRKRTRTRSRRTGKRAAVKPASQEQVPAQTAETANTSVASVVNPKPKRKVCKVKLAPKLKRQPRPAGTSKPHYVSNDEAVVISLRQDLF